MAIDIGRAKGAAEVAIDYKRCNSCGLCVNVCKGAPLYMEDGRVSIDQTRLFGCIGCGQCVCVCPFNCITVKGRDFSGDDLMKLPAKEDRATYSQLFDLMLARRSVRNFKEREVERSVVEQIVTAASTAPMGIPPSEVGLLVFQGRDKVKAFRRDLLDALKSWKKIMSPLVMAAMRLFVGKENHRLFKSFVIPAIDLYLDMDQQGEDWFFYDAPLALHFYSAATTDSADSCIAATYAMMAAESLGLGSCMIGFTGYALKYSKKLKRKYKLPDRMQPGICVIFGYPAFTYQKALRRHFAEVRYL
jgi:nitroreductase/NAD-dependent dihydropyrimidine dehydrogenase PreA subunit